MKTKAHSRPLRPSPAVDQPFRLRRSTPSIELVNHQVLLAAEDSDYAGFIQLALEDAGLHNPVQVLHNGLETIRYLQGEGHYGDRASYPMPAIVFLDLKLPPFKSLDVLRWIRAQPGLDGLHAVLLVESPAQPKALDVCRQRQTCFLVKPTEFPALRRALVQVLDFVA